MVAVLGTMNNIRHYDRHYIGNLHNVITDTAINTRSSAIAEGPRDASCQLKSCQLPRNSAETTYTTSPDHIDV